MFQRLCAWTVRAMCVASCAMLVMFVGSCSRRDERRAQPASHPPAVATDEPKAPLQPGPQPPPKEEEKLGEEKEEHVEEQEAEEVIAEGEPPVSTFELLLEAMSSPDPQIRVVATDSASETAGDAFARWCLERFDRASPIARAQMLVLFGRRGLAEALPKALGLIDDEDSDVRAAAIRAVAAIGGQSAIDRLVTLMGSGRADSRQLAREELVRMPGEGTNRAIAEAARKAPPELKGALLGVLVSRNATDVMDVILEACVDTDESVRIAALGALGALGGDGELERAFDMLVTSKTQRERTAAEKAVGALCSRSKDRPFCARLALARLVGAGRDAKVSLLRQLGRLGGAEALEAVRKAVKDQDGSIQDAGVRALADWPDVSAAADLLEIARSSPRETHRVLAFRAYVRVVSLPSERPPEQTLQMLKDAMAVARRPDDKKAVLAALADVSHPGALEMVRQALTDDALKAEAAAAAVKLAKLLAGSHREEVSPVLLKAIEVTSDENLRRQAREVIAMMERFDDYITSWQVSGPYTVEGKTGPELFDIEFPPERAGGQVSWRPVGGPADPNRPWLVNLGAIMGGDNRAAYLKTRIHSPKTQEAQLELGSDDGVKVWLNGTLVHANNATRGLNPGQDKVKISLREGWNELVLKVTQGGGDWSACARIRAPDGSALKGLKASAQ